MPLELQVSRQQKIISRILILLLVLGALSTQFAVVLHPKAAKIGDTTTYTSAASLLFAVEFGLFGFICCILGFFYGTQRSIFFRLVGTVIFSVGLYSFFNAPTGLNHSVVVTSDYFSKRIGPWYSPMDTTIIFKSVKYMDIEENKTADHGHLRYELRCNMETDPKEVRIEINDLLKAAVPEIYRRAAEHNVFIGDSPDGRLIPSDL
ncbi:MAG TPA: hypothetical protein VN625_08890 [Desulfuromonadaceae bacterium]|nr:hypothetical protein [Desulfuromonadaceae bacterium]